MIVELGLCRTRSETTWLVFSRGGSNIKFLLYPQDQYNWTVTYSSHSDVHLPYGKIVFKQRKWKHRRDYHAIAKHKTKDAVWIVSHCDTHSRREKYVELLKQYISVDVLGDCGRKWDCGIRYNHTAGNCFDILNTTYRYHLAFENTFCDGYITEKFYENYDYDIIQVVRGGNPKTRPIDINREAYINTNDFKTVQDLGKYLKALSNDNNKYASMLKAKNKYQAVPYIELFQEAACDICNRLHNPERYKSIYANINEWIHTEIPCFEPQDII